MRAKLRERLGLGDPASPGGEGRAERGVMARSLMYLFTAGAAITAASLFFSPSDAEETRIAITAAAAFGLAICLFLAYDRLPLWGFQVFLLAGTVLVEWAIYSSGETTSPYAMFYFWIAIYAFYFLSRPRALIQMGFIALAYSVTLFVRDDLATTPVLNWAVVTSTLVVSGALIGVQRNHVDGLIARL